MSGGGKSGGGSYTAASGTAAGGGGGGVLGLVRGLFLPPAFDSWPLPLLALLLHVAAALVAPFLLRLLKGDGGAQSKRAAILARMPSADGTLPPPPPLAGGGKTENHMSFMETMATQFGLGPLLGEGAARVWTIAMLKHKLF